MYLLLKPISILLFYFDSVYNLILIRNSPLAVPFPLDYQINKFRFPIKIAFYRDLRPLIVVFLISQTSWVHAHYLKKNFPITGCTKRDGWMGWGLNYAQWLSLLTFCIETLQIFYHFMWLSSSLVWIHQSNEMVRRGEARTIQRHRNNSSANDVAQFMEALVNKECKIIKQFTLLWMTLRRKVWTCYKWNAMKRNYRHYGRLWPPQKAERSERTRRRMNIVNLRVVDIITN